VGGSGAATAREGPSVIRSVLTRGRSGRLPWLPTQAAAAALLSSGGGVGDPSSTLRTERLPDGPAPAAGARGAALPASSAWSESAQRVA
jgi:hypothetical protein